MAILVFILFFISGFSSLIYEVLWTRQLSLVFGNTVYATSAVLAAYMGGLALGSYFLGKRADRVKNPLFFYGILEGLVGFFAILFPLYLSLLVPLYKIIYSPESGSLLLIIARFFLSFIFLIIPTACMGGTLPVLSRLFAVYKINHRGAGGKNNKNVIPRHAPCFTKEKSSSVNSAMKSFGMSISLLYGINTLGAVFGALAAGFYLLPKMGLNGTLILAVILNFIIFISAFLLSGNLPRPLFSNEGSPNLPQPLFKKEGSEPSFHKGGQGGFSEISTPKRAPASLEKRGAENDNITHSFTLLILVAYGLSGAIALALEVLWTRTLLLVFGSTVYSFTTMLACFLAGIALGSFIMGFFVDRIKKPIVWFGLLEAGICFTTLISISSVNGLPERFLNYLIRYGFDWNGFLLGKIFIAASILIPTTLLLGATFPIVAKITARIESAGSTVGKLYGANTLGAIIGSIAGGFIILPLFGMEKGLTFCALLSVLLGSFLIIISERPGTKPSTSFYKLGNTVLAIMLILTAIIWGIKRNPWDKRLLSAGVYFRPAAYMKEDRKTSVLMKTLGEYNLKAYLEGLTETASVVDTPTSRMFLVDGKVEASTTIADMRLQRLMGHLPMLFSKENDSAINIGLGCGITLGALTPYDGKMITCVELEPNITKTALFFAQENHHVLDNPKLRMIFNDGRNHLLLTNEKYDVITSDPFEPLVGGAANLYTKKHFENGRDHLKEGGVFCQYLPMYQLSPDDFNMIIRTFADVFPNANIWYTGIDTIMLGSNEEIKITSTELKGRLSQPKVKTSLSPLALSDMNHLLKTFVADLHKNPFYGNGPLNTDGNPILEFSAPKSHLLPTIPMNLEILLKARKPEDVPVIFNNEKEKSDFLAASSNEALIMEGIIERDLGSLTRAINLLEAAVALDSSDKIACLELSMAYLRISSALTNQGNLKEAEAILNKSIKIDPVGSGSLMQIATVYFKEGRLNEALNALNNVGKISGESSEITYKKGLVYQEMKETESAKENFLKAIKINPYEGEAFLALADLEMNRNNLKDAVKFYETGIKLEGESAEDLFYLGNCYAGLGGIQRARRLFERSLKLNGNNVNTLIALSRAEMLLGDNTKAKEHLIKAITIEPVIQSRIKDDPVLKQLLP